MAHYYARCERHGIVGPPRDASNPNARDKAYGDARNHILSVPEPHGEVIVILSQRVTSRNGRVYHKYTKFGMD